MFDIDGPLALFIWALVIIAFISVMPWWVWILIILGGLLWLIFSVLKDSGVGSGVGSSEEPEKKEPNYAPYSGHYSETNYHIDEDGTVHDNENYQIGYIDRDGTIYRYGSDGPEKIGYIDDCGNIRGKDGTSISHDDDDINDKINDIGLIIKGKKRH